MPDPTVKIGPMFFEKKGQKQMIMTPPIKAFEFGIDGILREISELDKDNEYLFMKRFNQILNDLVAEALIFFQNRIGLMSGSKPTYKSIDKVNTGCKKAFKKGLDEIIGKKRHKKLKKLDRARGERQHQNDRYFPNYTVGGKTLDSKNELKKYVKDLVKIINEAEYSFERIKPIYTVVESQEGNKKSIEIKAVNHSYDLIRNKINKKKPE